MLQTTLNSMWWINYIILQKITIKTKYLVIIKHKKI